MGPIESCQEILFSRWFARNLLIDIYTGDNYTDFTKLICSQFTSKHWLVKVQLINKKLWPDLYFKTHKS